MNFEIISLIKPYFLHDQQALFSTWPKIQDKNWNILRSKTAFKVKGKIFFIIFKELSSKQITQYFSQDKSLILITLKWCDHFQIIEWIPETFLKCLNYQKFEFCTAYSVIKTLVKNNDNLILENVTPRH